MEKPSEFDVDINIDISDEDLSDTRDSPEQSPAVGLKDEELSSQDKATANGAEEKKEIAEEKKDEDAEEKKEIVEESGDREENRETEKDREDLLPPVLKDYPKPGTLEEALLQIESMKQEISSCHARIIATDEAFADTKSVLINEKEMHKETMEALSETSDCLAEAETARTQAALQIIELKQTTLDLEAEYTAKMEQAEKSSVALLEEQQKVHNETVAAQKLNVSTAHATISTLQMEADSREARITELNETAQALRGKNNELTLALEQAKKESQQKAEYAASTTKFFRDQVSTLVKEKRMVLESVAMDRQRFRAASETWETEKSHMVKKSEESAHSIDARMQELEDEIAQTASSLRLSQAAESVLSNHNSSLKTRLSSNTAFFSTERKQMVSEKHKLLQQRGAAEAAQRNEAAHRRKIAEALSAITVDLDKEHKSQMESSQEARKANAETRVIQEKLVHTAHQLEEAQKASVLSERNAQAQASAGSSQMAAASSEAQTLRRELEAVSAQLATTTCRASDLEGELHKTKSALDEASNQLAKLPDKVHKARLQCKASQWALKEQSSSHAVERVQLSDQIQALSRTLKTQRNIYASQTKAAQEMSRLHTREATSAASGVRRKPPTVTRL
eukprot:TRINITY_DN2870_c0_g1_i2.p1 TRINITY_DN2870_c0_g1~~TRINITY_DN2870_c0_g1_i2.p1  ORF type:complete len:626 (-),score=181.64 TRINITY_DN2870_c0_g1_i2:6-1883(-)